MNTFNQTYTDLEPTMRHIVAKVRTVPVNKRPGTAHIDQMGGMAQYAFYTALVREWLPYVNAEILDWGGQHGQLTLLLSHYYPGITCYVLEGDEYDRAYGLSQWHTLLGIPGVVRALDPNRIVLNKRFDAAISSGVLEHVGECGGDERRSLEELHRVLKPNGVLFIWNLPRHYGRELFYPLFGRTAHIRRYRKMEIINLLQGHGFDVLYISTHEILPLAVLKQLERIVPLKSLFKGDYWFGEHTPWLTQNFWIVACAI